MSYRKMSLSRLLLTRIKKSRIFRKIFVGILLLSIAGFLGGLGYLGYLVLNAPSVETLKDYRPNTITRVYSDKNEIIDTFFMEDRRIISVQDVPPVVINAFIASEDARFFHHKGLDLFSISRAFLKNLVAREIVQGGSTITQQVAKSIYLSPERTIIRKIKEAILAYKIDQNMNKWEILELYLNHIYLGHGAYGIEAAAQVYFGKTTKDLTLPEAAMLAGLPKAPSKYSPYSNMERAKQRQDYVLIRMVEDSYISDADRNRALKAPIKLIAAAPKEKVAPYFTENVRRYVIEKYGSDALYREGLEIYTTLNVEMQKAAFAALERGLQEIEARVKYEAGSLQGALLCMDAKTGEIKAMVGGRDYKKSEFNRATQARRRPGSAFKPFIYTAAFDKGLTPATVIVDEPIEYEDKKRDKVWEPQNFDRKFHGPTTLRTALVHSRNVVTIKLLEEIGLGYAIDYAGNMGISSPLTRDLTLALGTSTLTVQEMVRGFGVLANQGKRVEPFFIKKIVDRTGHVLEENIPKEEQVIDPRIAYLTTNVLKDVVQEGTGERVKVIGRPVAGKTGTTDDFRDGWFIGFNPSLVTGVWVGFDDERNMAHNETGGRVAAPIWLYFMEQALAGQPVEYFPVPEGVTFVRIDPKTGLLAGFSQRDAIFECFLEGTEPTQQAPGSQDAPHPEP
jgi:penicillin-binding protein 1A